MDIDTPILPVQQVDDRIWLKRDDLYAPFDDCGLNGAKVYQCMSLLAGSKERIFNDYDGTVFTDTSLKSPQGSIVARVAREFGMKSILCVGTKDAQYAIDNYPAVRFAHRMGATIERVCGPGASMSLDVFAKRMHEGKHFHVAFGMNAVDAKTRDLVLGPVSLQAKAFHDLPTEDMTLVVPGGSCVAFSGLLLGLSREKIKFKRILSVQIAGYNRSARINAMTNAGPSWSSGSNPLPEYEHIADKTYPYAKEVRRSVGSVELDRGYEAKAWAWVERELPPSEKVLFYVVGNSNSVRE